MILLWDCTYFYKNKAFIVLSCLFNTILLVFTNFEKLERSFILSTPFVLSKPFVLLKLSALLKLFVLFIKTFYFIRIFYSVNNFHFIRIFYFVKILYFIKILCSVINPNLLRFSTLLRSFILPSFFTDLFNQNSSIFSLLLVSKYANDIL